MGKEQVIDYVMNSPANTNKAVLEGMLDGMDGANVPTPTVEDAGKVLGVNENGNYALTEASEGGYECNEEIEIIFEDSITTTVEVEGDTYASATLSTENTVDGNARVAVNGETYLVTFVDEACGAPYDDETGSFDWSEYPFAIAVGENGFIATPSAGTYQVKIESLNLDVEVTNCFKEAVKKCIIAPIIVKMTTSYGTISEVSHSADEIYQAVKAGIPVTIWWNPSGNPGVFDAILYTTSFQNDELVFNSIPYNGGESKVQYGASIRNNGGTYEWQFNGIVA